MFARENFSFKISKGVATAFMFSRPAVIARICDFVTSGNL